MYEAFISSNSWYAIKDEIVLSCALMLVGCWDFPGDLTSP
jgi:hypothetical protein